MPTPEDLIDDAYGYSAKTNPGVIATEDPELLGVVNRSTQAIYSIAAMVNPTFFGATATEAGGGGQWPLPSDLEALFWLEDDGTGEEVVVVPVQEKDVEEFKPSVYVLGQNLLPAGNASDPVPGTDTLKFYYSIQPALPGNITTSIDSSWDDAHNELLILQVAIYLATKDMGSQSEELQMFRALRNQELARFVRRLENHTATLVSRFGFRWEHASQSIVSHRELLDGALEG